MSLVKAISAKEMKPGELLSVKVSGRRILFVELAGDYYALDDICNHLGCPLSGGRLREASVECPCHGSVFDLKTGAALSGPALIPQPSYQVFLEGEYLFIEI